METTWDCTIVGGGAAGLSAALMLGRARRRTLLIDAGEPSNRHAHGVGGLLGHDGRPPAELYALGREQLGRYTSVEVRDGEVVGGERIGDRFTLTLADGSRELTRRVLLATGMDYRPPAVPGVEQLWGTTVFHCPFCHGWEVRERPLGVLDDNPDSGVHRALLLRFWSDDVVLFTNGPSTLDAAARERLWAANVAVDERRVERLVADDAGALAAIAFADGTQAERNGLLVPAPLHQRSALAEQLGATPSPEPGPVAVDPVAVDQMFLTAAPGVFAAGDLSGTMPSVPNAMAAGATAGAMVVQSLMAEQRG
ncbi:NAD(P)/FAD-dependent oxidoreductase [Conexibacter sp. CPCC 206217]|uniref:NAD(P)/FAD-dependent oxidoreductase n=1 Tax=Conexibacter sp. CPCC 206217 TaxID=3064574 RepID=UPI0027175B86|nr:NAD(P)/FAD-dependent oxidoreductase [Conexibacter sp. CPCC 206217]MDO8212378.1 NAD(P)/FAD-dependent oxidoreductase [Conexibacter sp. CPCC 206217]